jgi:predicted transcriptional regulator
MKFLLKLPDKLDSQVRDIADQKRRTITSIIIQAIEEFVARFKK